MGLSIGQGRSSPRPLRAGTLIVRPSPSRILSLPALLALLFALLCGPCFAVQPDEVMKDPALEARARQLSAELRCMVCQNQSIDDSDAPLAKDIRVLIRQRIEKGESNDQVRAYLVSRYGDFILLKPPLRLTTLLLWLAPPLVLLAGLAAIFTGRRRAAEATPPLSVEEEAALQAIAGDERDRA